MNRLGLKIKAGIFSIFFLSILSGQAQIRISEFMAKNESTLRDMDGDYEDWIELHNPTASAINLLGWRLSDNAGLLDKWRFPSVTIQPGGYLVVFASNKDRTTGELHTNFKLDGGGEFLALVRPDGSFEQKFEPVYPKQVNDISYGMTSIPVNERILVGDGFSARAFIPSDNTLGDSWKAIEFNDDNWLSGSLGVGYELSQNDPINYAELLGLDLRAMYGTNPSGYVRIPFVVDDPLAYTSMMLQMRYDDGFVVFINGTQIAAANAPSTLAYNSLAAAEQSDTAAINFEDFNVSASLGSLVAGTNILAIQVLNKSSTSSDLLCFPQLVVTKTTDTGFAYMNHPTPGEANKEGGKGLVKDTTFSVDRGYYETPFDVEIKTATAEAKIRYTLDGSPPSETAGTLYTGAIPISKTTVLRAIAYRPGYISSDIDTQTYLFADEILHQRGTGLSSANWGHRGPDWEMDPNVINSSDPAVRATVADLKSISTLSIVMDWNEMFGTDGIYISGEGVPRACSAELIDPTGGGDEFQINASVHIFGGSSINRWKTDKLSMRLKFTEEYGPSKLLYPVFGSDAADEFNTLVVDARLNNSWNYGFSSSQRKPAQSIRDQVVADMQNAMGGLAPHGRHVIVFINGICWGLHTLHERPDDSFVSQYMEGTRDEFDAVKHNQNTLAGGTLAAYQSMVAAANKDLSISANFEAVKAVVDLPALVDYMLVNYFVGNNDWAHQNWYATRKRTAPAGLWRYHSWDAEKCYMGSFDNVTGKDDNGGPTRVHNHLMHNLEYKIIFNDRVQKHFYQNGVLTPARATEIFMARANSIDSAIRIESARWGDNMEDASPYKTYTRLDWLTEQSRLTNPSNGLIPGRTATVLGQMASRGFLLSTPAPEFSSYGGVVAAPFTLSVTSSDTIYVTTDGSDPREYGTGAPSVAPCNGSVMIGQSTVVKARCYDNGKWSPLVEAIFVVDAPTDIRFSEIMYHAALPIGGETNYPFATEDYDFLELYNAGTQTVGLAGMKLSKGVSFDFSKALIPELAPGDHAVVVADLEAFQLRYPSVPLTRIAGEYRGQLDDTGETLKLTWDGLTNRTAVTYNNGWGWPLACEGAGHSLIPIAHPEELLKHAANWKASCNIGGSPGSAEPSVSDQLLINEVVAHTDTGQPIPFESNDQIELFNPNNTPLVLDAYWYLSDDFILPEKWNIPAGTTVPAHGWITFDENDFHTDRVVGFGLDKAGEQVILSHRPSSSTSRVVDCVRFKGQENGLSWGRYPDGDHFLQTLALTVGCANQLQTPALRIQKIMYHPYPLPSHNVEEELEYVQLVNPTETTIVLSNDGTKKTWRLNDGIHYAFSTNTTVAAHETLWIVPFNPTVTSNRAFFCATYGLDPTTTRLFGPFSGDLSNTGERIVLERPQASDDPYKPDNISWIIVDEAQWLDSAPWSTEADGKGQALSRLNGSGNDPLNWISPYDSDQDGQSDLDEYLAGTNPADPTSYLKITHHQRLENGDFILYWDSVLGRSYSIYWTSNLNSTAIFQAIRDYPSASYTDPLHPNQSTGFYFIETQPR